MDNGQDGRDLIHGRVFWVSFSSPLSEVGLRPNLYDGLIIGG